MHAPPKPPLITPKPPASRAHTMTDPSAFMLVGTEYDIVVARAFTITATSACLIAATPRDLVMPPLSVGTGTSSDLGLDGCHVVAAPEDGGTLSAYEALDSHRRYCWG